MLASRQQRYAEWDPASDDAPPVTAAEDAAVLDAHCAPADPRLLAVELKRTTDRFPPRKGWDEEDAAAAGDGLMEALEDVPLDIAQAALKRVRLECHFFPDPADIRERVVAELGERKRAAMKAKVAADMAARRKEQPPRRPPTDAERAQVAEAMAGLRRGMEDNPLKAKPEAPPSDAATALRAVKAQTAGFKLPSLDDPAVKKWLGAA